MKKIALLVLLALVLIACEDTGEDHQQADRRTQDDVQNRLQEVEPVPEITGAAARTAVRQHLERWQESDVVSFVTLFADAGQPIGYYTAQGKVASTCQMLTAPDRVVGGTNGGYVTRKAPALDGTYYTSGDCGIFFFTADSDAYVEWNGKYLVTDQPLPIDVEPLEVSGQEEN